MTSFSVLEQFSKGKLKNSSYTEDRVVGDDTVAVFDGARGLDYLETDIITEILTKASSLITDGQMPVKAAGLVH